MLKMHCTTEIIHNYSYYNTHHFCLHYAHDSQHDSSYKLHFLLCDSHVIALQIEIYRLFSPLLDENLISIIYHMDEMENNK